MLTSERRPLLLRARYVLPISRPLIGDGAVMVCGKRIAAVGRWRELSSAFSGRVQDLGEVILMPGLVNAHCHLDYTNMAGQFPPPRLFTDWIKLLTTTKSQWSYSEFAESWLAGARMLVRTGTTTVGDIEAIPELLPEVWQGTPLRVISFLEMTGVKSRRQPKAILEETVNRLRALPRARCRAGLSPHAPYSTLPELLRVSAQRASRARWPLAIHVAESAQEFEMFMRGRGHMFDWLRRNERDMSDCGLGSPVQHLARCRALRPNLLAIHVNYLAKADVPLLAQGKVSIVHCPRSHAYFRHDRFPFQRFSRLGLNICLGTDSLASVYQRRGHPVELSVFEEMRAFADAHPHVRPQKILNMVTVNAARALGLSGKVGQLSEKAFGDLIAVPFTGKPATIYEALVQFPGHVSASMIDGRWAIAPGQNP
jgi:aminodeoxyfutalosine deaminase